MVGGATWNEFFMESLQWKKGASCKVDDLLAIKHLAEMVATSSEL